MRSRFITVLVGVFVVAEGLSAQYLPRPTNANLIRFGYYFVNERYGDDTAVVWPYTNLYVAIPDGYDTSTSDWQTPLGQSLQKATLNHKAVYLLMMNKTQGPQVITWDAILDVAQSYWGQIAYIDVIQEASLDRNQMEQNIADLNYKIGSVRGLPLRPVGATFTPAAAETTDAVFASSLGFANVEAYLDGPGTGNVDIDNANMDALIESQLSHVEAAGKQVFITMQAFDRNGTWPNMTTLTALQDRAYLKAYNRTSVIGLLAFEFNRQAADGSQGGTKLHPELQPRHRQIGSAMAISPRMNIDTPAYGTTQTQPFAIAGWAIDLGAEPGTNTGVDTLHLWAYPVGGGSPQFVGVAAYGISRPDVGAAFGSSQWTPSGYTITVAGLAAGQYDFVVYSHSSVNNSFNLAQVVRLTVF